MKNIQIRMKKDDVNTTITIKKSILDLYSNTFFEKDYKDNKRFINSQIKNLINVKTTDLSQKVSKFLIELVQKKVNELKNELK